MKLYRIVALLLAAVCFTFAGCGGAPQAEKIAVPPTAIENSIRSTLEGYEKSGELGSSLTS